MIARLERRALQKKNDWSQRGVCWAFRRGTLHVAQARQRNGRNVKNEQVIAQALHITSHRIPPLFPQPSPFFHPCLLNHQHTHTHTSARPQAGRQAGRQVPSHSPQTPSSHTHTPAHFLSPSSSPALTPSLFNQLRPRTSPYRIAPLLEDPGMGR